MRACQAFECSSVLRYVLLVGVLGVRSTFAQSRTTVSCFPHHTWNGDDDDDDDDDDYHFSSWTKSWCAGPTGTGSAGGEEASSTGGTLGGVNSNLSTNGNGLSGGSIAGIVIGVVAALILGLLLALCLRRRYARRNQAHRATFIGPAIASATNASGTKEGGAVQTSRTMANIAPLLPPGLHRSLSRDTLPQIPYDTPAYTSTDNLASLAYIRSHTQRESTAASYSSPSEATTGVTAATAGHGSNGYGNTSFREDMSTRQKELETTYERKEMGELSSTSRSTPSRPDHSRIQMNLPDQAPPRYNG